MIAVFETLHTKRLDLKAITPKRIHELYDSLDQNALRDFFGFGEAGYEKYLNMHQGGLETYNISLFFFLILDRETGRPIGNCGFHTWNKTHHRAELYYFLHQDSDKGKGYISEVLPLVLEYGFQKLGLHRIQALTADWNLPSVKLLDRHGFVKEGVMRQDYLVNGNYEDSHCYALLKPEWLKSGS